MKTLNLHNHNNKFASDQFLVIARDMPAIPSDEIRKRFVIHDLSQQHPDFVAERITIIRFRANEVPEVVAQLADGITPEEVRVNYSPTAATANLCAVLMKKVKE